MIVATLHGKDKKVEKEGGGGIADGEEEEEKGKRKSRRRRRGRLRDQHTEKSSQVKSKTGALFRYFFFVMIKFASKTFLHEHKGGACVAER